MTEIQDWHFPPPSPASLWSRRAHAARGRRSGGTARTAAANATAPTGKYGEGQGHQHTESRPGRSGNAGSGTSRVVPGPYLRLFTLFMTASWKEWKDPPRFGQNLWINSRLASASGTLHKNLAEPAISLRPRTGPALPPAAEFAIVREWRGLMKKYNTPRLLDAVAAIQSAHAHEIPTRS
jgi:hypothetical protein